MGNQKDGGKAKLWFSFLPFCFPSLVVCWGSGCMRGGLLHRPTSLLSPPAPAVSGSCFLQPSITLPLSVLPVFQHLCNQFRFISPLKHLAWFLFPWLNPHPFCKQGSKRGEAQKALGSQGLSKTSDCGAQLWHSSPICCCLSEVNQKRNCISYGNTLF